MAVKPAYLLLAGGGGILVWSGLKGKSVTGVARALIGGDTPESAASTDTITGDSSLSTAASAGAAGGVATGVTAGTGFQNCLTVARYLMANGYSKAGAVGVATCVYGESGGDPDSIQSGGGGGGLIQWTPYQSYGIPITGNRTADLQAQLPLIIKYNNAQGSLVVAGLNAQTNPLTAAQYYSMYFERPAAQYSDVNPAIAAALYAAV